MSRPHSPTGKDPVVMVSSRINFPRGSSFKGEVMSCTWRASFPTLVAPMSHLAASRPGVALSLSLSLHYRGFPWTGGEATPVPSSMSCCPSWLHSCGLGPAAIAVLRAWTCHLSPGCHAWGSIHNETVVQFKTGITFRMEYSPLSCKQSSFWPRVFATSLRSWFVSFLNCLLTCASVPPRRGAVPRSSPNTQQEPELLQWLPGSAGQSTVMGWRGEQEASCYFL